MEVYIVGGWVRDKLLGLEPKDADFVVVGCSPQDMLDKGFKEVGKDFPVFIHPVTGDEYALARVERNVAQGYKGFECTWEGVTLEDDLERRDLTINAMCYPVEVYRDGSFNITGGLVDPFNGKVDLDNKVLSPVTDSFMEDPVRCLRAARFLSKYPEFKPSLYLTSMCTELKASGELESLVPERVWLETEKALNTNNPSIYFTFLQKYNVLGTNVKGMQNTVEQNIHHPEENVWEHTSMVMDYAAKTYRDSEINFACFMHDFGKEYCYTTYGKGFGHENEGLRFIEDFCDKFKAPNRYRELALLVCEHHQRVHSAIGRGANKGMTPKSIMNLFEKTKAEVKSGRFEKILKCCIADSKGRGLSVSEEYTLTKEYFLSKHYHQADYLLECLQAAKSVDTKVISGKLLANGKSGQTIGLEIRAAKIYAIRGVYNEWKGKELL
mgnify:CR=1 FL=1